MTDINEVIAKYCPPDDPNGIMNWDIFDESTVVTGATGSGKSTLVRDEVVPKLQGVPLWILDPKKRFSDCGIVVNDVEKLNKDFQQVFQPRDLSESMFRKFCAKLNNQSNIHAIIDEAPLWMSKQNKIKEHYDLAQSKRNDGVTVTTIATDTKAIPNYILRNVTHVYSLRYNLRSDVDWLFDYIGEKAEFLLTPDKREPIDTGFKFDDGQPITFKDLPMLAPYSYVYRDLRKHDASIMRGFAEN